MIRQNRYGALVNSEIGLLHPVKAVIEGIVGPIRTEKLRAPFPGLVIRYTSDGSEPLMDSPVYEGPIEAEGIISLRTFDTKGRGSLTTKLDCTNR